MEILGPSDRSLNGNSAFWVYAACGMCIGGAEILVFPEHSLNGEGT